MKQFAIWNLALGFFLAFAPVAALADVSLLNVSYDPTR